MRVSAGLCFQGERLWIFQRGPGRRNAGLWEFPGGKEEPGEDPAACLVRELGEELSLQISPPQAVHTARWDGMDFTFLRCRALNTPQLTEHADSALVMPRELLQYDFCPVDAPVARALALHAPPLRHLFWDLDGTVLDTYPGMVGCFCRAAAGFGLKAAPEDALALMKDSLSVCVATYANRGGLSPEALLAAFREEERLLPPEAVRPVPGIPETLEILRQGGGHHYLVTHRDGLARAYLRANGLEGMFTDVITSESGFPRKPAPDSLLHLMRVHGLPPEACVMIGDRPLDVEAGANAGMLGCLLDGEGRFDGYPCPLRARSAAELPELLAPEPLLPRRL